MTKREKALRKMRNNPKEVRFNDLAKVLEQYGFEVRKTGGSHKSLCEDNIASPSLFESHTCSSMWSKTLSGFLTRF